MKIIHTRDEFIAWAKEQKLRPDWHEPDEQDITARVEGTPLDFDNAGFWPYSNGYGDPGDVRAELHVIFSDCGIEDGLTVRGRDLACVNLATLCAWATGWEG